MGIFAQVWFWSALAFVVGALLSWALLALPARRRLAELERAADRPRSGRSTAERGSYDPPRRRGASPFDEPAAPPTGPDDEDDGFDPYHDDLAKPADRDDPGDLLFGTRDRRNDPAEPGLVKHSQPTVQVPVSGSLDGPFAPPEPPIPTTEPDPSESTQYLPAVHSVHPDPARTVEAPAEVDSAGELDPDRGWFVETDDDAADDAANTTITAPPDTRTATGSVAPDDDADDDQGTIFTQRTTPISGDLIARLDGRNTQEPAAEPGTDDSDPVEAEPAEPTESTVDSADPGSESDVDDADPAEDGQLPSLPVRTPGANRFGAHGQQSFLPADSPADAGQSSLLPPATPMPMPTASQSEQVAQQRAAAGQAPVTRQRISSGTSTRTPAAPAVPDFGSATQGEPERTRSLFEPLVPAEQGSAASRGADADLEADDDMGEDDDNDGDSAVSSGPFGPGSAMPLPGGGAPSPEYTVKASVTALRYCGPESPVFGRTVAEVWFRNSTDAERVGFRPLT